MGDPNAVTVWKQQRPDWCPHPDCAYRASSQGCLCVGELPEPTPHYGDFNTHRLCIAQSCPGDDEWLFKLEINSGDANGIARVLGRVFGFKPVALARIEARSDASLAEIMLVRGE